MGEVFGGIVGRMTTIQKLAIGLPMGAALLFALTMCFVMLWGLTMYRRGRHDLYRASDDYVFSLYIGLMISCLVGVACIVVTL